MNKLLLLLLCFLLVSCATTQVHLFTESLSEEETIEISRRLELQGYKVSLNTLPIPPGITKSTLVYSPLNKRIADIEHLLDIISDDDYGSPEIALVGLENHFYTRNNVGLYLFESGQRKQDLSESELRRYALEYYGHCKTGDSTLALKPDGSLKLDGYIWEEATQKEVTFSVEGTWMVSDKKILLTLNGNSPVAFSIQPSQGKNKHEQHYKSITLLRDENTDFYDDCDFVYTVMVFPEGRDK